VDVFSSVAAIGNCAVVCTLLLLPLLHPASMPRQTLSILLAPLPPAPQVVHAFRQASVATRPVASLNLTTPRVIHDRISRVDDEALPSDPALISSEGGLSGSPGGLPDSINAVPPPSVHVVPARKPSVSSGVMEGRKLSGNDPRYPTTAIAEHMQGTVVLAATISKIGTIQNLRLLSGPLMLAAAAEEAVRTWRYRPYQLNGNPVDVETTVTVVFHLGD
jgi:periplasmic protein TonB